MAERQPASSWVLLLLILGVLILFSWLTSRREKPTVSEPYPAVEEDADSELAAGSEPAPSREDAIREALNYLDHPDYADEVAWWEVDGNDVYIGVKRTDQLHSLVVPAAMECHKAIDFGCHAWAVRASVARRGWRPGDSPHLCEATVRYGKVEGTDCPQP